MSAWIICWAGRIIRKSTNKCRGDHIGRSYKRMQNAPAGMAGAFYIEIRIATGAGHPRNDREIYSAALMAFNSSS